MGRRSVHAGQELEGRPVKVGKGGGIDKIRKGGIAKTKTADV